LAGVAAVIASIAVVALQFGPRVIALYVGPYVVMNAWVVLYTRLHHTDVGVEHLDDPEWTNVRSAFLTVDRSYPRLIDVLHHRIGSSHVVHHLDPAIPFRRASLATREIATRGPDIYRHDPTPITGAAWRSWRDCRSVSPSAPSVFEFLPQRKSPK